ncbi:MAG TPA: S8 family serine peptidase, partial [Actinoplanes sp.]|nr:S8 family serine peptidase [Actinoplanes sp.]
AGFLAAFVVAALCGPVAANAQSTRWVVPAGRVLPTGSVVVGSFPLANALVVASPTAPEGGVAYDAPLQMQSLPAEADPITGLRVDSGVASTGAPEVWSTGELGENAVVALVDTGVAPVPALQEAVVGEIDFSGSGGGDGYGHGTFLASLIAGAGTDAPGVAPQAGILSLKVGRDDGTATLGSVLSALQWLYAVGRPAGVRIATLALGVDPSTDAAVVLDAAADTLADAGMLIVTAAGNDGAGNLTSPATAAGSFSVGAVNDQGTADRSDDTASEFSASGQDRDGVAQPDVVAPGELIVSSIGADSVIAQENPQAWVEPGLFRGSGTSMATALTAGVAALASSARPDLDGTALAEALRAGGGVADAPAAVAAAEAAPAAPEKPGKGPKWAHDEPVDHPGASRGNGKGRPESVEPNGVRWTGVRWTGVRWTGVRWTGVRWTGVRWTGDSWGDETWTPGAWGGVRWTAGGWAGDIDADWAGVRWTGVRWTGVRWTGVRWTGVRWTGVRWTMLEAPPQ